MASIKDEEIEQIKAMDWIRNSYPDAALRAIHIANERNTSFFYGKILKRMGVKKGAPDLFFCFASSGFHGMFIEVKRKNGGKLSKEQKDFISQANNDGYFACVAYGAQNVINYFCDYFNLPRGKILEGPMYADPDIKTPF